MQPDFREYLKFAALQNGGRLFGIADLTPAREFINGMGWNTSGEYPRAISIGMRLLDSIVDGHSPAERHEDSLYWHHIYGVVTPALDQLALKICLELQAEGYRAFPVPGSLPYNQETLRGVFSHKLAAHLAGLGWIGKNCLLITPEFGPRVRFTTILTDALLEPGTPLQRKCGRCRKCVVACPAGAIKNREFEPDEPVEKRLDIRACHRYRLHHSCGICVARCPQSHRRQKETE